MPDKPLLDDAILSSGELRKRLVRTQTELNLLKKLLPLAERRERERDQLNRMERRLAVAHAG